MLLLTVLGITTAGAASADSFGDSASDSRTTWVRTVDGWETLAALSAEPRRESPSLHPFAVAGFQALGSVLALIALERRPRG